MLGNDIIKSVVKVVEEVDYLYGRAVSTQGREAHYVREIYAALVIVLRLYNLTSLQLLHYAPTKCISNATVLSNSLTKIKRLELSVKVL